MHSAKVAIVTVITVSLCIISIWFATVWLLPLNKISYGEKIVRDGKIHNLSQLHINESIMDKRHCHLNNLNNKLLAETLKETLENKKTKIIVDLFKELKWQEFDPRMESVYGFKRGLL